MVRSINGLAACAAMVTSHSTLSDSVKIPAKSLQFKLTARSPSSPPPRRRTHFGQPMLPEWRVHPSINTSNLERVAKSKKASRKLPQGALHTPNEFFDRSTTLHDLPPLPQVFENKLEQNSPFFREGYIGNLFIEGDEAQWRHINKSGGEFYPPPIKVSIKDVILNLSGQSSREYAKLAYQMKVPKKQRLLDLSTLKLRNEETDATKMREKIYVDILNSLGVPVQQSAYVRLFFNGEPLDLFVTVEEMKKHWIKRILHPGVKGVKPGALWKMNSCCGHEGNLEWLGPTTKSYVVEDIYTNINPGNNPKDDLMEDLIQFMAELKNYNPGEVKDPIAFWNERLDLDLFLKSMEYLTSSWDSYWNAGSNYQFNNDSVTDKWTWLPTDFDDTFGTSLDGKLGSYKDIPKKNKKGFESPLAQELIMETLQIRDRFEEILKDTVDYVFKIDALSARLDAYKEMIQEDVVWDHSLQRLSKGKNEKFTTEYLGKGINNGVKSGWGIKKWVKERSEGVQKDLGFKATARHQGSLPPHDLNCPFRVVSQQHVSATTAVKTNSTKSIVGKKEHGTMSSQSDAPALSSSGNQAEIRAIFLVHRIARIPSLTVLNRKRESGTEEHASIGRTNGIRSGGKSFYSAYRRSGHSTHGHSQQQQQK
ncbi:hypothetical protein BGX34_001877 [Mortierella sp. NVP85]|nr:hypothetical protein BGX34_001877 [Mortierella sp. NVP85]